MCEGLGYNETQCKDIGCCQFHDDACHSGTGSRLCNATNTHVDDGDEHENGPASFATASSTCSTCNMGACGNSTTVACVGGRCACAYGGTYTAGNVAHVHDADEDYNQPAAADGCNQCRHAYDCYAAAVEVFELESDDEEGAISAWASIYDPNVFDVAGRGLWNAWSVHAVSTAADGHVFSSTPATDMFRCYGSSETETESDTLINMCACVFGGTWPHSCRANPNATTDNLLSSGATSPEGDTKQSPDTKRPLLPRVTPSDYGSGVNATTDASEFLINSVNYICDGATA